MSAFDYWNMTPREVNLMCKGYMENLKKEAELNSQAVRVGVSNAMSGKSRSLFKKKKDDVNYVTSEERQREIAEINKIFGV